MSLLTNHRNASAMHRVCLAMLVLSMVSSVGCVRRRLTVNSTPPGATVFVDNQPIGTTPCSVDFTYYGTREIRLVKSGFETLTVNQPIPAPWYQIPPLDFISDNFWPVPIRDNRTVAFNLEPQRLQSIDEIIARGSELRGQVQQNRVVPAEANLPVPPTIVPPTIVPPGGPTMTAPLAAPLSDAPSLAPMNQPTNPQPVFGPPPNGLPSIPTQPLGGEVVPSPAPFRY